MGRSLFAARRVVVLDEVAVGVPAADAHLHEAHAALDQPPRQQAARAELGRLRRRPGRTGAVVAVALAAQVERLAGGRLHAEGQLVAPQPGLQFGVAAVLLQVLAVERVERSSWACAAARGVTPGGMARLGMPSFLTTTPW